MGNESNESAGRYGTDPGFEAGHVGDKIGEIKGRVKCVRRLNS